MITPMKIGKRIHRILISVDDSTFILLSHAANYDRKDLATFVGHMVEQQVHGLKIKLPDDVLAGNENDCATE